MYTTVTTTRKDGSARQDRLYLTRSTILAQLRNNAEQCCGCPKRQPTFHCSRAVAAMRSGRLTQGIAGSNDEVERTADPPSS